MCRCCAPDVRARGQASLFRDGGEARISSLWCARFAPACLIVAAGVDLMGAAGTRTDRPKLLAVTARPRPIRGQQPAQI